MVERNSHPAVSVIVPVYGVEAFVGRCVRSLMEQTMSEAVEYIIVNDATADGSMAVVSRVLADYPGRKGQERIITHEANRGLPAARNTGLAVARGEYVIHCDSDDFVEPDMLERLYAKAKEENADMVWCDWYLHNDGCDRYMRQPAAISAEEALRAMLAGAMKFNVWNKLVRRSLYTDNGILFPTGYGMGEDMTMIRLAACARHVAYMPQALYHYTTANAQSYSNAWTERHLEELRHNVGETSAFVLARCGSSWERYVAFLKLQAKFPFLISDGRRGEYALWQHWYPEANACIWQNRRLTVRARLLQWLAAKGQFRMVRLYDRIVTRWLMRRLYGK